MSHSFCEHLQHHLGHYLILLNREARDVRRASNREFKQLLSALCDNDNDNNDVDVMDAINNEALRRECSDHNITLRDAFFKYKSIVSTLKRSDVPPFVFLTVKRSSVVDKTFGEVMNLRRFNRLPHESILSILSYVPDEFIPKLFVSCRHLAEIATNARTYVFFFVTGQPQCGKTFVANIIAEKLNADLGEGTATVTNFSDVVRQAYARTVKVDAVAMATDPILRDAHREALSSFWAENFPLEKVCEGMVSARHAWTCVTAGYQAPRIVIIADWRREMEAAYFEARNIPTFRIRVTCSGEVKAQRVAVAGLVPRAASATHDAEVSTVKVQLTIENEPSGSGFILEAIVKSEMVEMVRKMLKAGMQSRRGLD
eukprot:PhM_4_TR10264/c0_g1_i2/m.66508